MLLAINVGNTNTAIGLFEGEFLAGVLRTPTRPKHTQANYCSLLRGSLGDMCFSADEVTGAAICSALLPAVPALADACRECFSIDPYVVDPKNESSIKIRYKPKSHLGADRLVNAVAAFALYGGPAVVIDFGTATTFNAVSRDGEYLGGAIAPGIGTSINALLEAAPRLPEVELKRPPSPIGNTTETSLQSGIVYGFIGQVEQMVARFRQEIGGDARVIATGGWSEFMGDQTPIIRVVNPNLTLEGLRIIYDRSVRRRADSQS